MGCALLVLPAVVRLALLGHRRSAVVLPHLLGHHLSPLYGVWNLGLEEACRGLEVGLLRDVVDQVVEVLLVEWQAGVAELQDLLLELSSTSESVGGIFILLSELRHRLSLLVASRCGRVGGADMLFSHWISLRLLVTQVPQGLSRELK